MSQNKGKLQAPKIIPVKPKPTIKERNAFERFMDNLKIKYVNGQNPLGRAQTGHGFFPTKNAALNFGSLLKIPYDPEMRIRKGDPAHVLREITEGIGRTERIHNTYLQPRVKLAD
jgi:hypothetical protein